MELLKKQEYQKMKIEDITKAAGVSKPTFFAYFKSKQYRLVVKELQNRIGKSFQLY